MKRKALLANHFLSLFVRFLQDTQGKRSILRTDEKMTGGIPMQFTCPLVAVEDLSVTRRFY